LATRDISMESKRENMIHHRYWAVDFLVSFLNHDCDTQPFLL
jgi:hypothetical protein